MDWSGLLRAGLFALRLTPEQFWRLTPMELRIMLGAEAANPPLTRARLEELARAFPDVKGPADGHDRGA
ncbi:phage tail assembly chaperone [Cereibacter sp. SYSU M97828]|nr:phage tail assembly chaperone [Cereibacter flavus]